MPWLSQWLFRFCLGGAITVFGCCEALEMDAPKLFGRLPLLFEQGLSNRFASRGPGYSAYFAPNEFAIALHPRHSASPEIPKRERIHPPPAASNLSRSADIAAPESNHRGGWLRVKLLESSTLARGEGREESETRVNYFIGNDSTRWRRGVPTYASLRYREVYPGIDVVHHGNQGQLEFDFVVAPGADPGLIALGLEGAESVEIDDGGDLLLRTPSGVLRQQKPVVYQEVEGKRTVIPGRYTLHTRETSSRREWVVGFELGAYDPTQPLVIDPVLMYSTVLAGAALDRVWDVALDATGSAYVTGQTSSTNFPTANPFEDEYNGGTSDLFVARLSPAGTNLLWATYLGGNQDDVAYALALGPGGNVYVTGATFSSNFPVTLNAVATNIHGEAFLEIYRYDAFVVKLDSNGSNLLYSTFLGGANEDNGLGIAVDQTGNAYVTGFTSSFDFPTNGVASAPGGGLFDAFVAKLTTTDTNLIYSSFLGGTGDDRGQSIALDGTDRLIVAGFTSSTDFPLTNALQTNYLGGIYDSFITRLSVDGWQRLSSTYIGGNASDNAARVVVDGGRNMYLAGYTSSTDFPVRNALFSTNAGSSDVFVMKLDPTGTNVLYSTYLGGADVDEGWGLAVDGAGGAYVTGESFSRNFFTTNALQSTNAGGSDVFFFKLNPAGTRVEFSTLLGGVNDDHGFVVSLDSEGNAYLGGENISTNFGQTLGGGGIADGFVSKFFPGSASLRAERTVANVSVFWPKALVNYELQSAPEVAQTNGWTTVTNAPVVSAGENAVTFTNTTGEGFFRLRRLY